MTDLTLAAIMTCHNRRDTTIGCLENLFKQQGLSGQLKITCFLTDDGCNDGTSDEIRRTYQCVTILSGNGSLYWNGGMRLAWAQAMRHEHDFYLWLNDDTLLFPNAVQRLLETYHFLSAQGSECHIVAGAVKDATTNEHSYGGVVRSSRWHPFKYKLVTPAAAEPNRCDTVNGNLVLVPKAVVRKVGNLEPAFTHGMGDFDYALRATRQGCEIWVAPGFMGTCSKNSAINTWVDPQLSIRERWRKAQHPKGLPTYEWKVFSQRYGGRVWPLFWIMPYIKLITLSLIKRGKVSLLPIVHQR
jgi:GT2 family glycosyltransferase